MKIKGFYNSKIYVYGKGIIKTSLLVEEGKISKIDEDIKREELLQFGEEFIVIPGFVDKHIHGANGSDFMNPSQEDLRTISTAIAQEGTTSCLATTMTPSLENIGNAVANIAEYMENKPFGVEILGIHLEGPCVSKRVAGAQPPEFIIPCDKEVLDSLNQKAKQKVKQVTLAYEENGEAVLEHLIQQGIVVSLGHSYCTYEQAKKAIDAGASSVSHMFNAMSPIHHREIGLVGAGLVEDKVSCELICDLIHVSKPAVNLLFKAKGHQKICLITDSIEAKYMPDGKYELGGQPVFVKNNEARLKDGTLAGSTLKMNEAVRNFMKATGSSLIEAVDCATINPARCLHVEKKKGSIEVGKDADFVVIDKELNVIMTICRGEVVYSKK